ncbi:hypothetical protein BN126_66 [Cronobacter sakazakii 680]|nr:hypothetical protein BN129_2730 [Cronobacter sakazakii 701]CCK08617.1 hypothetical protein BN128_2664 [Cronobacter sakazakii 696]CCK09938.1 hypothetical protein BN126_66 [Cronobacter sakazakii 680]
MCAYITGSVSDKSSYDETLSCWRQQVRLSLHNESEHV